MALIRSKRVMAWLQQLPRIETMLGQHTSRLRTNRFGFSRAGRGRLAWTPVGGKGFGFEVDSYSVAITRRLPRPKKIKLPPAHLYLDDLEEIIAILKPENEDSPPELRFTVDDEDCDSVEDLRLIGARKVAGRVGQFEMNVHWKQPYLNDHLEIARHWRADLSVGGTVQRQTWLRNQVHGVFARRIHWLWRLRWLVAVGCVVGWLVIFHFWFRFLIQFPLFKAHPNYLFVFDIVAGVFGVWPLSWLAGECVQSTVILENCQRPQGNVFQRHRDQIIIAVVTALITAPATALITSLVRKWLDTK
jgi:hypothetical protein